MLAIIGAGLVTIGGVLLLWGLLGLVDEHRYLHKTIRGLDQWRERHIEKQPFDA